MRVLNTICQAAKGSGLLLLSALIFTMISCGSKTISPDEDPVTAKASATLPIITTQNNRAEYVKILPAETTGVAPGKIEVDEFFWYGCSHCFAIDSDVESWRKKNKPPDVEFRRIPGMAIESARTHARIFYTAELLGDLDELHPIIFSEIQSGNDFLDVDQIAKFFLKHGVGQQQFRKAFYSSEVEGRLKEADLLNQRYKIDSVPTFIVNGAYRTSEEMAGSKAKVFLLINELAARKGDK
jgi:protein dithiol oxidoreductase (disulfide-forming)